MATISVIIPAYNEEKSITFVLAEIPYDLISEVIVVNNNSSDNTEFVSKKAGATVLTEVRQGYGSACLRGIYYLKKKESAIDIVVFLDADYSDYPDEMKKLVKPIIEDGYDMVIGSRELGNRQAGSMLPQQIFGNWLATSLMKIMYGVKYTDLGPFRAIKFSKLVEMDMRDTTYGWTVEMQLKAAKLGYKTCEVPVNYKRRIGKSKIAGTVKGTVMAGYKIITTIIKYY